MRKLVEKLRLFIAIKNWRFTKSYSQDPIHSKWICAYNILHKYLSWNIFKCSRIPNFVRPNQFFNLWKVSNMTNNLPTRQLRDILGHPTQTLALFRLVTQSFSVPMEEDRLRTKLLVFSLTEDFHHLNLTGVLCLGKKIDWSFLSGNT